MSIKTHTCLTITCDVCDYRYDQDEYTVHFDHLAEARDITLTSGWTITTDRKVICGAQDDEHQKHIDVLLPPEPARQVPGQIAIDGTEAS